jgi:hypothetical protein
MADITIPGPRQILIRPWDPTSLRAIGTAISRSRIGLMPTIDGGAIRLAFDSKVQGQVGRRPANTSEWLEALDEISDDIAVFESINGPLADVVASRIAHLGVGRLFDMALGPRTRESAARAGPDGRRYSQP